MFDLYYGNTDLKLLLDMLASSNSIAHSLTLLAMLNKNFRKKLSITNFTTEFEYDKETDSTNAIVRFNDAKAIGVFCKIAKVDSIYVVTISPPVQSVS